MPVPSLISELSQTPGSNYPSGSESPTTADNYFRAYAAFIATLRDGKGFSAPVALASAGTTDIGGQNAFFVEVSGTTTITSFGTNYNGPRFGTFSGALTLTHNATSLILPGGANITTAAGDACVVVPKNAGNGWKVVSYQPAALLLQPASETVQGAVELATAAEVRTGTDTARVPSVANLRAGLLVSGTNVSLSGSSVDFTSIPSWVKRITVQLNGLSTNGTSIPIVQPGDAGGIETTGYLGSTVTMQGGGANSGTSFTTGVGVAGVNIAAAVIHVDVVLTLQDAATNTWKASVVGSQSNAANGITGGSSKSLSATLDRIRITTVGGSDNFDTGSANILYE